MIFARTISQQALAKTLHLTQAACSTGCQPVYDCSLHGLPACVVQASSLHDAKGGMFR